MSDSIRPTILIVDDENDILDLFEIYLFKEYEVHTATNGFDGLKRAERLHPACVVTDIMMPVMDGIRFINRFRKLPGMAAVPVIACTAFSSTLQKSSLTSIGFSEVLTKPISQKILLATIRNALAGGVHAP